MTLSWNELIEQMQKGSPRALSRMISRVENRESGWMDAMKKIYPLTGNAAMVGVTGPPGAGKSTLTNGIIKVLASEGKSVGVIAVDPSSPFSGGSLLGDRLRMKDVWDLNEVFIRSMATRGALGGLNQSARDVAKILDAFGKDFILIETVGVGQDEIEVVKSTDLVILVCVPGQGDSIQALKAGIMEIADIFVINKADRQGVHELEMDIKGMLDLSSSLQSHQPPIIRTIANQGKGLSGLVAAIREILSHRQSRPDWQRSRIRGELIGLVEKQLISVIQNRWEKGDGLANAVESVMLGETNPYSVAEEMLAPLLLDLDENKTT